MKQKSSFVFVPIVWKMALWGFVAAVLMFAMAGLGLFGEMPEIEELENPKSALASEIYGDDGSLIGKFYLENRTNIRFQDLSPGTIQALVATEDVRFYKHSGIDLRGLIRAVIHLGKDGGASTLSQQVAKNLFHRMDKPSNKLTRILQKFKEQIIAVQLERRYSKQEIAAMYLNTVPFSGISFGIQAASKEFFNKDPKELSIEESAVLVGMLKANHRYNPKFNPENALSRRNTVLEQMNKYGFLNDDSLAMIKALPIQLQYRTAAMDGLAPYFRTQLGEYLKGWCKERGLNLYKSGLKIYTTINPVMQEHAEKAIGQHLSVFQTQFDKSWGKDLPWRYLSDRKVIPNFIETHLKRTERWRSVAATYGDDENRILAELKKPVPMTIFTWQGEKDTLMSPYDSLAYVKRLLQAGLLAIEPETGFVKAWVGGIDHKFFKYDHVNRNARRQVGSTFKPLVYATALDINKFHPCTEFERKKITFEFDGQTWSPKNFDNSEGGIYTLKKGLAMSDNLITAQVMQSLGANAPELVVKFAERVGIEKDRVPAVPSICLGTVELSPFEMASAYSAFVNKGLWIEPSFITRIEDKDGNVLEEFQSPRHDQVLSEENAYIMFHLLKNVVDAGTAAGLKGRFQVSGHIGGKTGTTQGAADGWFMGVSKGLVCATWVGADDPVIRVRTSAMGQGGRMAMPIFGYFFGAVQKDSRIKVDTDMIPAPAGLPANFLDCDAYRQRQGSDAGGQNLNIDGLGI